MYSENSTKRTQMNSNKKRRAINIYETLGMLLVIAVCFLGDLKNTTLSTLVVGALAFYILKPVYLIGPIFFMTIFDDYLVAFNGQSFSRFCVIFFCVGALLNMLVKQRKLKYMSETLMVFVMLALGILLSFVSVYGYTAFPLSYVFNLALFFCLMNFVVQDSDCIIRQLYKYTLLGIVFIAVLVLQNGTDVLLGARMTIDSDVNANQIAMGLAQMVAVVISHSIINKRGIFDYALLFVLFAGLFLTGSRTGLIAAFVCIFVTYFVGIWKSASKRKKFKSVVTAVLVGVLICGLYLFLAKKAPALMSRFTYENVASTGGTGRLDGWIALLTQALPGHYICGIGFEPMNAYYAVQSIKGVGHGSHNLLVEILTKSGIVGLVIYATFFFNAFKNITRNLRHCYELLMPFAMIVAILLNGIGEDVLTTRFLWFGAGLVYVFLNASRKEVSNRKNRIALRGEYYG